MQTVPANPDVVGRRGARRTALWLALVAVAVYLGFLASGVLGR